MMTVRLKVLVLLLAVLVVGLVGWRLIDRHFQEKARIRAEIKGLMAGFAGQHGEDEGTPFGVTDAVKALAKYSPEDLEEHTGEFDRRFMCALDLPFLIRCHRLEPEALSALGDYLASREVRTLTTGMYGLDLAVSAGLPQSQFLNLWNNLSTEAKHHLVFNTLSGGHKSLNDLVEQLPENNDSFVSACILILKVNLGKMDALELRHRAEQSNDTVFRGMVGDRLACTGDISGLKLLAESAARPSEERDFFLTQLYCRLVPPPFDSDRFKDTSPENPILHTNWREWVEARERQLAFSDGAFRSPADSMATPEGSP
jgi:hypothetical protein